MRRIPFRLKLTAVFTALIIVGVTLIFYFEYKRERALIENGYLQQAETIASTLTPIFFEPLLLGYVASPDHYRNILTRIISTNQDLRDMRVLQDDGTPLALDLEAVGEPIDPKHHLNLLRPIEVRYAGARRRAIGWLDLDFHSGRIDEVLKTSLRRSVMTASALLILGFVAAWIISRGVTAPLARLAAAMARLREGNLSVSVPVTSRDEIGDLSAAFNETVEGLRAKNELLHYVSRSAWEAAHRRATGANEVTGTTRTLTVLFSDIQGFTPMTEKTPAHEVVLRLNAYFDAMVRIVLRHGGTIDKFIGDAIMALFEGEDAGASGAVAAGREMQKELEELRRLGATDFHIRVGVNTGDVILGDIGSISARRDYTCIGDAVNVASRLCYGCPTDAVHVGQETYRQLSDTPAAEKRTGFRVKGIDRDLETYVLSSEVRVPSEE